VNGSTARPGGTAGQDSRKTLVPICMAMGTGRGALFTPGACREVFPGFLLAGPPSLASSGWPPVDAHIGRQVLLLRFRPVAGSGALRLSEPELRRLRCRL